MRVTVVICVVVLLSACQREGGHMRAAVPELSGLVKSRKHPGVFWAHPDSGNAAELWAIDAMGRTLGRYRLNAKNDDWEDIAADAAGNLYIGDIGDNFGMRSERAVLRVREPDPIRAQGSLKVDAIQHFRYPNTSDGKRRKLDAEALIFADGRLHVLSKQRVSTVTSQYRFPIAFTKHTAALEHVADIELKTKKSQVSAPVTAADVSRDGTRVALTTHQHLYVFTFGGTIRERLYVNRLPKKGGIEALAFDGARLLAGREDGTLVPLLIPLAVQPAY